ncbi:uncharacterized protein TNCV_875751 [Trichonephila clavipes]|nr:uncharacterized protein TNCV_875751 [Trichonephila clavipes]
MAALVSEYTLEFFRLLKARSKKELIEWCMKEGLIASSYECPKCNEQMALNERKSVVLDGFEWRCRKKGLNCLQENRLKVNSEREQDSPVEMGASNISRFKEMPFLKAKSHRAHSVVSGVRVKVSKQKKRSRA